jgi:hypothetical protein
MFIIEVQRDGWCAGFASPALKVCSFHRAKVFASDREAELFGRRLIDSFPALFAAGGLSLRVLPLDSARRLAA